jgi:hypothetical protein
MLTEHIDMVWIARGVSAGACLIAMLAIAIGC